MDFINYTPRQLIRKQEQVLANMKRRTESAIHLVKPESWNHKRKRHSRMVKELRKLLKTNPVTSVL